jgi:hypothetical protein
MAAASGCRAAGKEGEIGGRGGSSYQVGEPGSIRGKYKHRQENAAYASDHEMTNASRSQ